MTQVYMGRKWYFLIFSFLCTTGLWAQNNSTNKKDTIQFQDDPIASSLDSLAHLNFFEKGYDVIKSNHYHFAPDSIPQYSDAVYTERLARLDANSPFSLQFNDVVKQYIDLYVRRRQLTSRILGLSKLYFPMIEQVLDRYNMPLELKYLAVVESALNPTACSRTGARGLWQFMYTTGKLYNLRITSYVDERNDPVKSTIAACKYLKFLYNTFGNWQLAIAAYNCGPLEVSKAIRRSGGKVNFWQIRPYLPRETAGYVPAFIAVNYIMNYATSHNIYPSIPNESYFDVDTVVVHQELTFAEISTYLHIPIDKIAYLNPCYKLGVIPYSSDECYSLCLPIPAVGVFVANENAIYNLAKKDTLTSRQILAMEDDLPAVDYHRVRQGETLGEIANRYHCTVRQLKEWNGLRSSRLRIGQHLMVYSRHRHYDRRSGYNNHIAKYRRGGRHGGNIYVVQSGDTLWDISRATGVPIAKLKSINHLNSSSLKPGTKLKLVAAN